MKSKRPSVADTLFLPAVPREQMHQNFLRLLELGRVADQDVIRGWAEGFIDRDGKFVKEFQTSFNSSFWELYLFACFKELGFDIDLSHDAPDYLLRSGESLVCAEAVIASNPLDYRPEWKPELTREALMSKDLSLFLAQATIRLANSITEKHRKFQRRYSTLPHVKGRPFVVCVAPFEQPFFYYQNSQAITRVLYSYDQPLFVTHPETGEKVVVGESLVDEIEKPGGARIPLGFFTDDRMKEISAVIFSTTATWVKARALSPARDNWSIFHALRFNPDSTLPFDITKRGSDYSETLLDGLHVLMNPFATYPLDLSPFRGREVKIHGYDIEDKTYVMIQSPKGFLLQRDSISIIPTDKRVDIPSVLIDEKSLKAMSPPVRQDGELWPVKGYLGTTVDLHMCAYKGWTILMGRDIEDNDWSVMAKRGSYFTLPSFQQARASNSKDEFIRVSCESKEDASKAAFEYIDKVG